MAIQKLKFSEQMKLCEKQHNYYIDNTGLYKIPINNPYESGKKIDLTIFLC